MTFSLRVSFVGLFCALFCVWVPAVHAARWQYQPSSDGSDGQLVDGTTWQPKLSDVTDADLLLNLGSTGGSRYENSIVFAAPNLTHGQSVNDVRLRVNMQGGPLTSPFDVIISAALSANPDTATGASRFLLPRTAATITWHIDAAWDSSGQREAKWAETPNLAKIVNEVGAARLERQRARKIASSSRSPGSPARHVRFDDTHPAGRSAVTRESTRRG
jgi:hypothetical protein